MNEPINPSSNSMTPGVLLKNTREEKGLSVIDVAARLCLSVQFIEDIERDDYSHLSATTYARGYVRSYAHLLGIPEKTILASLDNTHMEFAHPKNLLPLENESRIPITQPSENSHPRSSLLRWGSILVLLILAGLVVMWWRGPANQNIPTTSTTMTSVPLQPNTGTPAPASSRPSAAAPTATNSNMPTPAAAPAASTPSRDSSNATPPASPAETAPMQVIPKNTDTTPVQPSEMGNSQPRAAVTLPAPRASDDD